MPLIHIDTDRASPTSTYYSKTRYTYPQRVPHADSTRACTPGIALRIVHESYHMQCNFHADIMHAHCDCWVRSRSRVACLERRIRQSSLAVYICMRSRFGFQPHAYKLPELPGTRITCFAMSMRISVTDIIREPNEPRAKALGNQQVNPRIFPTYAICSLHLLNMLVDQ